MPHIIHWVDNDGALLCGAHTGYGSGFRGEITCGTCRRILNGPQPSAPATDRASPVKPVERRATVAEGETRLALLERLLGEIVEADDEIREAYKLFDECDEACMREEQHRAVEAAEDRIAYAIESARAATGGENG